MAALTIQSLRDMQTDEEFSSFWKIIMTGLEEVDVTERTLPRKRRMPCSGNHPFGHKMLHTSKMSTKLALLCTLTC